MQVTADEILRFIEIYKYLILFPLTIIEGTIVTIIAGFLASLGVLNIFMVIALAIIADLTGDTIYYSIGRIGREKLIEKWGHLVGLSVASVRSLEKRYERHAAKMLFVGKFAFGLEVVSLVVAGVAKVPYRKFIAFVFLPTVPKYTFYALLGYFFGSAYVTIGNILHDLVLAVPVFLVLLIGGFFVYRWLSPMVLRRIKIK